MNDKLEKIAEAVHNAWWQEKIKQGVTDHPDMLPYADLAENIKEYDRVTARAVIKALPELQGWIPVSERLPDCDCFVYESNSGRVLFSYDDEYDAVDWNVTHWMPRPQPPSVTK